MNADNSYDEQVECWKCGRELVRSRVETDDDCLCRECWQIEMEAEQPE